MESAKAPENSSAVTEKAFLLPAPKVFFSKTKSQSSATVSALDNQPHESASITEIRKSGDESGKLSVGSRVTVGGVKQGILRFLGRVHFMEGDWCGVELDEPEGLHDGTVEQVRYFTCKNGHGIFAPRSKVSLMHDSKSSDQKSNFWRQSHSGGDAESQFQHESAGSLENVVSSLVSGEPVQVREKLMKPSKLVRPRSVVSSVDIDLKEASIQSKLPRPKSAMVSLANEDSNSDVDLRVRRSSLLDYASLAKQQRASPKRVTFDDTLEYDLLSSSRISAGKLRKSDLQGEGYTSDEGSYDSASRHAHFDPYMALTLTYDLESSPPRKNTKTIMKSEGIKKSVEKIKITTSVETQELDSTQSALEVDRLKRVIPAGSIGDSNQGATEQLLHDIFDRMEEEISDIPTPDTAEVQMIIPDSLSSSEEDARRIFSSDGRGLTGALLHQKKQVRLDSDRRLGKHSVTENDERSGEMRGTKGATEDSLEGTNHSEELGLKMGAAPVTSSNMGGELQALTKKASFELARTALAQYADLIRAAQEDRTHRLAKASVKPKPQSSSVFDPSLEEPPTAEPLLEESTEGLHGGFLDPSWSKDRTGRVKTFDDVGLSDSVDSLNVEINESLTSVHRDGFDEYETFEGEDLRTISADDVIVDSDEEFIEGERLAISGELDLEDSLIIDLQPLINAPFQHPPAVSEGYQDVDGNLDDPASVPVNPEIIGQISEDDWNNTINNMRHHESDASGLVPLVLRRRKQQSRPVSMVSTASSDAGIVDDLLPGYGQKHERPISLISSTSSTDTGCPMEVDSDMLSSTMLSSTLDDLAESWQEPGSASTTATWLKSYAEPDVQERLKGEELIDYPFTVLSANGNFGKELCITDADLQIIKAENDQKSVETAKLCGEIPFFGSGKEDIKTKQLEKDIDLIKKSYEKMSSVLLKLDSDSKQKDLSTDVDFSLPSSSRVPDSIGSSQEDQLVLPEKGFHCAEFPQRVTSRIPVSVHADNSSTGMVSATEEQRDVKFSSEIQKYPCSGLEPVLAKVLAISGETSEARFLHDQDLQVYMVSEESGLATGKLVSSEDACLGDKGASKGEVQLENKHIAVRKTEPEHQGTSTDESRMEEKGDEKKPELDKMGAGVKESHRKDSAGFSDCPTNSFVERTVNSEEVILDKTFSNGVEATELVPSSEKIQLRDNGFGTDEAFKEDAVEIMPDDDNNDQDEVQADQKMNIGTASVSLCKESIVGRSKEISRLKKDPELLHDEFIGEGFQESAVDHRTESLQKLNNEDRGDLMKGDAGRVGWRKEETDSSDAVAKQKMMAVVSDSYGNSSGTAQEAVVLGSSMIADIDLALESALGNDSLVEAGGNTAALSEVVEVAVTSELVSDVIKEATDGGDVVSGKAENIVLSEGQGTVTSSTEEIVIGFAERRETVLGLVKGSNTVSETVQDDSALLRLVESNGTVSETTDIEKVDQRLLGQVEDTEGIASRDVMQQAQSAVQDHETRSSSDARKEGHEDSRQVVKNALGNVVLKPDGNEEGNEIEGMSTETNDDATGDSEVAGKVALNPKEKRVPEADTTDGGNVSKGARNGHATTPSKLMVKGNVRVEVKTKRGKADDNRDIKDDSAAGNGRAKQKALNVGKITKGDSESITGKSEAISGSIKLEKTPSDVGKIVQDGSSAENGNTRRRLPNSSRNVKSDSANMKNVTDNTRIIRSRSNLDRNTKNDPDSMADSVKTKLNAVKNQNKDPSAEPSKALKGNSKKKSASVSEPMESSVGKDLGSSASESSESDDTVRDKRSVNSVQLSAGKSTSAAKVSGAIGGRKSKQDKVSESASGIFDDKRKILNADATKDAKPYKATVAKIGGLSTSAPARKSGLSPTSSVPSSARSTGSKFLSSQETLIDSKAESGQDNVKMGNGRKIPGHNPGSTVVAQKRGSSSNPGSRLSNPIKIVNAVPGKKNYPTMMSKKESIKADQVRTLQSPRASLQQSSKAAGGNLTQGSSTVNPSSRRGIPKPGSAAGHSDGDKTISKKQTKESEAPKSYSRKLSKDAKSQADSSSQLTLQVNELKLQLKQTQQQLDGGVKEREELELKVAQIKEEHASEIRKIHQKHQQEIDSLKKAFVEQTKTEIEKVIDQHSHEVKTLKSYHDRHLSEAKQDHRVALESREKEFQDAIAKLKAEHLVELNETKASHEQQLNEISERFEEIKISLSSKVEQLRSRCDELCSRELCYKDTCKRETDLREQAALEVDSLRVVLEQRNGEIRKLRQQNALLDEKVQEIPVLKERITKLQQSIENLEAVNSLKSGHEKQLADMHQVLLRKFERESKAMKRLSMENEELMWRLSQSDFGPSCLQEKFPPGSSAISSLMSRSYDSQQAAAMTHRTPRSHPDANSEATMSRSYDGFSDFYTSTPKAVSSQEAGAQSARSSSSSISGSSHSQRVKLRRSGTYEVMDQENFEHKP